VELRFLFAVDTGQMDRDLSLEAQQNLPTTLGNENDVIFTPICCDLDMANCRLSRAAIQLSFLKEYL
jgi:hypothetical protein